MRTACDVRGASGRHKSQHEAYVGVERAEANDSVGGGSRYDGSGSITLVAASMVQAYSGTARAAIR